METKETTNGMATRTDKFELLFDVSAMHISMADYDSVAVSALTDEHGYGNGFKLNDYETNVNVIADITYKNTVTDGRGNFRKAKVLIEIKQEYHTDIPDYTEADQVKTPEQLIEAMKNQLGNMTHYYRTSYDEGDIANVSLDRATYIEPEKNKK